MPLTLKAKPGVVWNVVPEIDKAQATIAKCYKDHDAEAVVTSAKDGKHSANSAHNQANKKPASAIDLRIWLLYPTVSLYDAKEWWKKVLAFSEELARRLNEGRTKGNFYVVLEKDHIHCEYSEKVPNIKAFATGQYGYTTKEVRGYLA